MAGKVTIRTAGVVGALVLATTQIALAQGAATRLDGVVAELAVQDKEAVARSRYYQEVGKRFLEEMKYQEARAALLRAVSLDPNNKEATSLLDRVNEVLGLRMPGVQTALEKLAGERTVVVQEKLVDLENSLKHAQRTLMKIGEVEKDTSKSIEWRLAEQVRLSSRAIEQAERAREIIKWMPYEVNTSDHKVSADRLLREARQISASKVEALRNAKVRTGQHEIEARRMEDRHMEEQKVARLLDQVQMLFDQERYRDSERLANEVLKVDPMNYRGNELWVSSRDQQHRKREQELRISRKEQKMLLDEMLSEASVPYSDYLVYGPDWDVISQRESVEAQEAGEPEWKRDVRRMLDRKVTFEFVDTPLQEAIRFLETLTRTTLVLDARAFEGGAGATSPITLRVSDMPLHLALRWILRLADLDYVLKDEAVFISTPRNLGGEVDLKIYDVRDLTYTITQFAGPELILTAQQQGAGMGPIGLEESMPEQQFSSGSLADLVMNRVMPGSWAPELGTSIEERSGKLVVMQKPEVHRLIAQLLKTFRESQTLQVMVQSRFLEVRESFLEDIGVDFADLPAGSTAGSTGTPFSGTSLMIDDDHPFIAAANSSTGLLVANDRDSFPSGAYEYWLRSTSYNNRVLPFGTRLGNPLVSPLGSGQGATFQFRFVGNAVAQAILHAVKKEEQGDLLLAPRMTMYNNQRAYIMSVVQRPFIADYDVQGLSYDPVIETMMEGTILDVRPTVSHDRRYVTLTMQPGTADQLTFTTLTIVVGTGALQARYPIMLPQIRLRSTRTTVTVPDGGTILLSGLMTDVKYHSASGVPFFSDLPIVGRLFGSDLKQREKINLIVLVSTNLILFDEEEAKL
jgi:general secretion pathway protein D